MDTEIAKRHKESTIITYKPPKFLKNGDMVRIEIGGIGVLENPVKTESMVE